ncbi:hypothetical protein KUTeg_022739 [Tegillarca granosa]|uniref:Uncharacterized protein n=1 Tax=Tegillarca granosa TaxID=220873 RepID=A0ABQ9E3F2_TEGGR|nr:hypothetical protein KUTeg_022739 [Tegillarca granosa]
MKTLDTPPIGTSANPGSAYVEDPKWGKQILVSRDPVFVNKTVIGGHYIGRKPYNYLPLAIFVTIFNPILGPLGIIFSVMSNRSYYDGDLKYSQKWANYSFMCSMLTIGISIIVYIAIGFSLSEMGFRGGQSY